MKIEHVKKIKMPNKPGVYFFLKTSPRPSPGRRGSSFPFQGKAGDEVLYIGKATSLRDRTRSYFTNDLINTRGPLILDMVFKADRIDWQETESVLEALILEAELIKKHQPYYNTREKDDKSFLSVVITGEKLPRVFTIRTRNLKEHPNILKNVRISKVYGSFPNGPQLREALKIIRKIFPFLDDKSKNYMEFYKQINLVPDLNDRKMYLQNIRNIKLFFEGKKKKVLKNLQKEMKEYAKRREFEKAGEIKRQIFALQHINDVALIKNSPHPSPLLVKERGNSTFRIEAYDIAHMGGKNMVGVMTVVENGEVEKSEYKKFKIRTQAGTNDTGALKEVLERRLAYTEWPYPNLIVVDGGVAQLHLAMAVLKNLNLKIPTVSVVKDERHKPKDILGSKEFSINYKRDILLGNSEAHRFAIAYHKKIRNKNFLK
ncbi:hypothetical protein A3A03_00750 [Candidatus Nomurabacteria bacterium RIFCSPLOWO2_01_FULL_40_18]|uniref:Excinuclease ABC subunit C n=1 Tax=Candidatus Nomurabacteria bacterium RIFCSPLOWO2_01_FULL_40_18 TaxID=1801773 RepID=A0A1F6XIL6_9BACT|nr:MAG: hypothetical protein A3A03_00750 [Candidatus Nomurabacteria bacterium RIFCSPLOWO2_01_FULL_40_18]